MITDNTKLYTIPEAFLLISQLWGNNRPMPAGNINNKSYSTQEGLTNQVDGWLNMGAKHFLLYYADPYYPHNVSSLWLPSTLIIDATHSITDY